ncbi:MAG: hypothetical protein KAS75_04340 [Planctomycetes bacterium]|nr:hypothetical protein [Planctomycetota bacterium]
MRTRDIITYSLCITITTGLLITAGMQLDFINSQRKEMKLISNEPLENAPPSLAFATIAMGAFRGLVVDALWLRADRLKDQGQFFDAKQIAEWITTLQPRFAAVWEFQAWNMAYNISVAIPASQPDQRWQWVKNGYELLRDQGIPMNPKSLLLYRELARIFQHKIGDVSDDAHKYYKLQLARSMEALIPPSAGNDYFEALTKAPIDWQQFSKDPEVTPLITSLKTADKTFDDNSQFPDHYLSLRQNPNRFTPEALRAIDNFRGTKALKKLDIFAKAYHLRKIWKLDPILMNELNKQYGPVANYDDPNQQLPLDWRHPDTHAIYWATKGLQVAAKNDYSADATNITRIINHSLQNLFRNGKIFIHKIPAAQIPDAPDKTPGLYKIDIFLRPDLRMFAPYNKSLIAVIEKFSADDQATYNSMRIGHRNMLKNAAFSFYQAGHMQQARRIYNQLRKLYPEDEFKVSLAVFAKNRLREELSILGLNNAKEIVQMMLIESYFRYAIRDDDQAFAREKMAKEVYDFYQASYSDENRVNLPELKMLKYFALLDFFNDPQYPFTLKQSLLARIKLERPDIAEQLKQQEEKLLKQNQPQNQ